MGWLRFEFFFILNLFIFVLLQLVDDNLQKKSID